MHDIFYFTDIHGQWNLYKTIIDYCLNQDPECHIIFGGDACDRGPDGYKIMKHLINSPHIGYLKGNHEEIFVDAARELHEKFQFPNLDRQHLIMRLNATQTMPDKYPGLALAIYNGGEDTLADWIIDGMPMDFVETIDKLPLTFSYGYYDFCHAGSVFPVFQRVAEAEYNEVFPQLVDLKSLLWDRSSFQYGWAANRICVHGHTPTVFLPSYYYGKNKSESSIHPCYWQGNWNLEKYNGYKLDMDTGATFTGRAYVFNLLTKKITGFFDPAVVNQKGEIKQIESYYLEEKENNNT